MVTIIYISIYVFSEVFFNWHFVSKQVGDSFKASNAKVIQNELMSWQSYYLSIMPIFIAHRTKVLLLS